MKIGERNGNMRENGLTAESLAVGYGRNILISGIDINLKKGRIITLIGPNGAGKSTILKSISRQISPLGGAVYIGEKELQSFDGISLAKKMSLMMTGRADAELMTCGEAASAGRYPYTGRLGILSPEDKRAVREAMELTDVLSIENRYISQISDGQRQRVLLARAICQEPEILVLDEPTSFLDIRHKLKLLDILRRLVRERNIGVIMSMHELDMAERISDYVICVGEKGIAAQGSPEEIFTRERITALYGIDSGSFEERFCTAELSAPEGEPRVFVIAGNGSGTAVFRRLQRLDTPFITGIIHENDLDFPAAVSLAARVISEKPFELISEEHEQAAVRLIDGCERVICPLDSFGTMNEANRRLREYAKKIGKLSE